MWDLLSWLQYDKSLAVACKLLIAARGIWFSDWSVIVPGPPALGAGVLATELPEKSLILTIFKCVVQWFTHTGMQLSPPSIARTFFIFPD